MANLALITWDAANERNKRRESASQTIDFTSVRIGASLLEVKEVGGKLSFSDVELVDVTSIEIGASGLKILETGGHFDFSNKKLTNVADPTAAQDVATKSYVDAVATGLDIKNSVRLATTAALPANTPAGSGVGKTLTANANGALTVDSVAVAAGNRILVKDESTAANNGIYVVTAPGDGSNPYVLTRATDFDQNAEVTAGAFTFVAEGTVYADSGFVLTTDDPITVDTTGLAFSQFSGAGSIIAGAGLLKTGNQIDVELHTAAAATGSGSGGGSSGLEFDTAGAGGKLRAAVDAAGAIERAAGGLAVRVDSAAGIEISANQLRIASSAAGAGLGYAAGVLSVNVDDSTIEISSDTLRVKDGGITSAKLATSVAGAGIVGGGGSPLDVELDTAAASTGAGSGGGSSGLEFDAAGSAGKLRAAVSSGGALTRQADGLRVEVDGTSIERNSNALRIAAGAAGSGLGYAAGVLSVNVDNSTVEIATDTVQVKDAGITPAKLSAGVGGKGLLLGASDLDVELDTAAASTGAGNGGGSSGLEFDTAGAAGKLRAAVASGGALTRQSDGLRVEVDGTSIERSSNALRIASGAAGAGIGYSAGVLAVNTGDGIQIASDAVAADYRQDLVNDNAGSITVGQVVYVKSNGNVDLAQATVAALDDAQLGVVADASIATTATGKVFIRRGAVISGFSGLTPGKLVYVSRATAGGTTQALTGWLAGEHVYSIGRALSATQVTFDPQYIMEF